MSVMRDASRLVREGKPRQAIAAVHEAAARDDQEALLALAHWKLFGLYGERDVSGAHELLARGAELGNLEAAHIRALLIGNGTGCAADPERARSLLERIAGADPGAAGQLALLPTMAPPELVDGLPVEILCRDPAIRIVRSLLAPAECRYLMALAEPSLQPSTVVDAGTGRRVPHPVRTSAGTNFGPTQEDLVVHAINRRIAAASGTDVACGEPLHILRYTAGQEYRPHVDALPGAANQRGWTALVYLNGDYLGGETRFTQLGITVRGNPGDALIFRNLAGDGRSDARTRHAGLPVSSGAKWLATRWIREAPYDPFCGS